MNMERLRKASEFGRLGPGVNKKTSEALHEAALGHTPLQVRADAQVYVYLERSDAGEVMAAVSQPSEPGAARLRHLLSPEASDDGATTKAMLHDVKALVIQLNGALEMTEEDEGAE